MNAKLQFLQNILDAKTGYEKKPFPNIKVQTRIYRLRPVALTGFKLAISENKMFTGGMCMTDGGNGISYQVVVADNTTPLMEDNDAFVVETVVNVETCKPNPALAELIESFRKTYFSEL